MTRLPYPLRIFISGTHGGSLRRGIGRSNRRRCGGGNCTGSHSGSDGGHRSGMKARLDGG